MFLSDLPLDLLSKWSRAIDHLVFYKRGLQSQTVGRENTIESPEEGKAHGETAYEGQVIQAHPTSPLGCRIRIDSGNEAGWDKVRRAALGPGPKFTYEEGTRPPPERPQGLASLARC